MTDQESLELLKTHNEKCSGCDKLCDDMCKPAVELAISALERQIPKKSKHQGCYDGDGVWHEWNGINGRPYELCPNCETNLCCEIPSDRKPKFCDNCGQALDWNDND